MKQAAIRLRNLARSSLVLTELRFRTLGRDPNEFAVRKGRTGICIEAFPRSANSFAVRMFHLANPDVVVAHHTHSAGNLARAIQLGIPALTIIRDPLHAISSSVIASPRHDVDDEVCRYLVFHEWVRKNLADLVVTRFETVTGDFNEVVNRANHRFGTSFNLLANVEAAAERVMTDIQERYEGLGLQAQTNNMPLPSMQRADMKEKWRVEVANHPSFGRARALYLELAA